MAGLSTAIPANEDVVTFFCRNEAKTGESDVSFCQKCCVWGVSLLFTLGLCTLANTTRDAPLQLVRCPYALIPFLYSDCHPDAVTDAIATPSGADTALEGVSRSSTLGKR